MKIIFLGATKFSEEIINHLLKNGINISAIFYIPEYFIISYRQSLVRNYNYADLKTLAQENKIPNYEVNSVTGKKLLDYKEIISLFQPDLILTIGWYYKVPESIRNLAKYGAWGIHASLLPQYGGGAPLVWAIINGEKETGVTLFKLSEGVDDGDIIAQFKFNIGKDDYIEHVYRKAIKASKRILLSSLKNIDCLKLKPQNKNLIQIFSQREPKDGEIDLSKNAKELYNFIRAQTKPYPGAYLKTIDGKKLIIERVRVEDF